MILCNVLHSLHSC